MRRRYGPLLILLLAPLVMAAPLLLTGRVLYWGVPLLQFYPWQHTAAGLWQAGQWPLWNPLVGSGAPLAANLQTGVFYPLNVLHLILPTEYAQTDTALLHVLLAGLFMYAYLRTLRLNAWAAVIGALAYQLCGFFIARLAFFSVTAAFPWIAAWLWRAEKLVGRGRPPTAGESTDQRAGGRVLRDVIWLAAAIGLGVLAGHAQTAVYGLIFVACYVVWRAMAQRTSRPLSVVRPVGLFGIAALLGLALAAVQLLPAAELTRESQRAGGLDYTRIMTHSYWPLRWLTLLAPDFFGNPARNNFWGYDNYWENAAYIGVLPLLLALWAAGQGIKEWGARLKARRSGAPANQPTGEEAIALRSRGTLPAAHHSSLAAFFGLAVIVSFVLALGWFTPIYPWLYEHVPGFGLFQGPARWLAVTEAALAVLAALGAQRWLEQGFSRRAARRWVLIGAALALAGGAAVLVLAGRAATFAPATLQLGVLLILGGAALGGRPVHAGRQAFAAGLVALDLIAAHGALNPALSPEVYHAPNPAAEAIRADGARGRVFVFDADENAIKFGRYLAVDQKFIGYGPNELAHWLNLRATFTPNAAMIDGLPSANNFDSLIVGRYQQLLDQVNALPLDQALPILGRMHVAYIVSPRSLDLPIVYRTPDVTIYRNPAVQPRARIAANVSDLSEAARIPGAAVESLTDSGNAVTIRAASPADGYLVLADVDYPGWQARLDGMPTPIELAEGAFRAVKLPAGAHTIEFRYEPESVKIGLGMTLAVAAVLAAGLIGSIGAARRRGA